MINHRCLEMALRGQVRYTTYGAAGVLRGNEVDVRRVTHVIIVVTGVSGERARVVATLCLFTLTSHVATMSKR